MFGHRRYYVSERSSRSIRSTTILGVRRDGIIAMAGDGQVTVGDVVLKHGARKIRTLYDGAVIAGFAGAVADAYPFSKFETQLKTSDRNLRKASVELAKEWRTDRYLRRLEAQLIVGDGESLLVLSGEGDVIEPDDGIAAIGSGAPYATAAAKALLAHRSSAREIVESAMGIAAELCIFTNDRFTIDSVEGPARSPSAGDAGVRTPQQRWTTRIERNGRGTTTHCASPTQRTSVPDAAGDVPIMEDLTPAQIVAELDRFIIGQGDAKRAVAVALRNRFRRQLLPEDARRGGAEEHSHDGSDRGWQDRDCTAGRQDRRCTIRQSRSHPFHRSRLCGKGCRVDRARSV